MHRDQKGGPPQRRHPSAEVPRMPMTTIDRSQGHNGVGYFVYRVNDIIDEERAMELQFQAGYPVDRWRFYDFHYEHGMTVWSSNACANSPLKVV